MRKFRGTSASGQRPRGNSIASGHDPERYILLEPPDIRVGGSSVVPLAGVPVPRTEPSDKLCLVSIPWWPASQNKTANTYIIDIPR
jgi:hypothetical protein